MDTENLAQILITIFTTVITWIVLQMSQPINKIPSNDQPMDNDEDTEFAHLQIARAAFVEDISIPRTASKYLLYLL